MPISRSERDVLFGTTVPSRQMEKYLAQKKTCTFEQFRNEFHDLSRGLFWSSFIRLTHGGKAVKEDEIIRYTGDPDLMRGRNIELAWKTMQILGTFTNADIVRTCGVQLAYVQHLTKTWTADGYLAPIGRQKTGRVYAYVYRMLSSSPVCPKSVRSRK